MNVVDKASKKRCFFGRRFVNEFSDGIHAVFPYIREHRNSIRKTFVLRTKKQAHRNGRLAISFSQMLIECTLPHTSKFRYFPDGIFPRIVKLQGFLDRV